MDEALNEGHATEAVSGTQVCARLVERPLASSARAILVALSSVTPFRLDLRLDRRVDFAWE